MNVGDILDIRPLVSADRKYVTMDVRPFNSTAEFFTERISVLTTDFTDPVVGFTGVFFPAGFRLSHRVAELAG